MIQQGWIVTCFPVFEMKRAPYFIGFWIDPSGFEKPNKSLMIARFPSPGAGPEVGVPVSISEMVNG